MTAEPSLLDFEHLPLAPTEVPLQRLRPSPRLLWTDGIPAFALIFVTVVVPYAIDFVASLFTGVARPSVAAALGASGVGLELVLLGPRLVRTWLHVIFTTYALTTERVYVQTRFLSTQLTILPYEKITFVRFFCGPFGRLFGISDLHLSAYGVLSGHQALRGLRQPLAVLDLVQGRMRVHNSAKALVRTD